MSMILRKAGGEDSGIHIDAQRNQSRGCRNGFVLSHQKHKNINAAEHMPAEAMQKQGADQQAQTK